MWLLCQQRTGFRHFSQRLTSAEGWGEIYGACCADTLPAVPPPERRGGTGTAPGCSGCSRGPPALRGAVEGWGFSRRVIWAAQRGLGTLQGRKRAPLLFCVLRSLPGVGEGFVHEDVCCACWGVGREVRQIFSLTSFLSCSFPLPTLTYKHPSPVTSRSLWA